MLLIQNITLPAAENRTTFTLKFKSLEGFKKYPTRTKPTSVQLQLPHWRRVCVPRSTSFAEERKFGARHLEEPLERSNGLHYRQDELQVQDIPSILRFLLVPLPIFLSPFFLSMTSFFFTSAALYSYTRPHSRYIEPALYCRWLKMHSLGNSFFLSYVIYAISPRLREDAYILFPFWQEFSEKVA